MHRTKLHKHNALSSPTKEDLRNGPSRDKLPEKVRRMSKSETACGICGVSYLVFSEVKDLEEKLKTARAELAEAAAKFETRGTDKVGNGGGGGAPTADGDAKAKRLQLQVAELTAENGATQQALAAHQKRSTDTEQRLSSKLADQERAHASALGDALAAVADAQRHAQQERQQRNQEETLLVKCKLKLSRAGASLRLERATLLEMRGEFEKGRAAIDAGLQHMAEQLQARLRMQSDKARAEICAHEMAANAATIALAAEQREVESLRLQLSQQLGAARCSEGDLSRRLATKTEECQASQAELEEVRRNAARLVEQGEAQQVAHTAAVASLEQRVQAATEKGCAVQEQLSALRCHEETAKASAQHARDQMSELRNTLQEKVSECAELALQRGVAEGDNKSAQARLRELDASHAAAEARAADALRACEVLRVQLGELKAARGSSVAQYSEMESESEQLRAALRVAVETQAQLAKDATASKSAALEQQRQEHAAELRAERAAQESRVAEADAARHTADEQQRVLHAKLASQREASVAQASAAERDAAQQSERHRTAAVAQQEAAQRREQLLAKQAGIRTRELEQQLACAKESANQEGREGRRVVAQCASVQEQLAAARARVSQLERENEADKENDGADLERLEGTLIKLTSLCREKDLQIRHLRQTVHKECAERTRILNDLAVQQQRQ